jgi:hypothetical protein
VTKREVLTGPGWLRHDGEDEEEQEEDLDLEHLLHPYHVEPAALLEADLLEVGDFLEAEFCMQRHAAFLIGIDATEDGVMAEFLGEAKQFREDLAADSPAPAFVMKINGIFHAVFVGRARVKLAERTPTYYGAAHVIRGDDHRMLGAMGHVPVHALLLGAGHGLISAGGVQDIVIVDGVDRRKVGIGGGAKGGHLCLS